jgi:mono/diheme cytochrome c family protein
MHAIIRGVLMYALLITAGGIPQDTTKSQEAYLPRPSYLAMGDASAGRRAYLALKCNTCHTVAGERIGAKAPRLPGPQIGKSLAMRSPEQIAESIAAPQHTISKRRGRPQESSGSMGDYTHVMTVRQLMDLIAYFRSL